MTVFIKSRERRRIRAFTRALLDLASPGGGLGEVFSQRLGLALKSAEEAVVALLLKISVVLPHLLTFQPELFWREVS